MISESFEDGISLEEFLKEQSFQVMLQELDSHLLNLSLLF